MENVNEKYNEIADEIIKNIERFSEEQIDEKHKKIENRLFDFANFIEANITLIYLPRKYEINTINIIRRCLEINKTIVLPAFNDEKEIVSLMKIEDLDNDLTLGFNGLYQLNPGKYKIVPVDDIDIAIIPGIGFDEKGGRIGSGDGLYNEFITKLPMTTRKIIIAYEEQIVPLVPVETRNKYIDILITDKRIIYKI